MSKYWVEVSTWRGISLGATHWYTRLHRSDDGWEEDIGEPGAGDGHANREDAIAAGVARFDEVAAPGDELWGYRHVDRLADTGRLVKTTA